MTRRTADQRHQILALTGGGFRGLFTARFLALCEAEWPMDWRERFQLFAGTSVGGLLAAGLAVGRSAKDLATAIEEHGASIFPRRLFNGPRRLVGSAPYETQALRAVVEQVLGTDKDILLSDFAGKLALTAVNYSRGSTEIFTSAGLAGHDASRIGLVDAVLASAAAPTYFPMVRIGRYDFADGGMVANAPDLIALIQALDRQHAELQRCYMLSVGTAGWREGVALSQVPDRPGIVQALWRRRLVQTTMAAQEDLALQHIRVLLRDRHLRVDREPDEARAAEIRAIDNATPAAAAALNLVAEEAWQDWRGRQRTDHDHRLRDFFAR